MWGLPVAFIVGYAFARYFGDSVKSIVEHTYAEIGKVVGEWL